MDVTIINDDCFLFCSEALLQSRPLPHIPDLPDGEAVAAPGTPLPLDTANRFLQNLDAVSDEHGERFHQAYGKRYNGKVPSNALADFAEKINRETTDKTYKRKRSTK
ncbi:hypothetical protein EVAR_33149_1 [Eumeta japonica]|uniref:Uncharacterized protein n=1 Tax=Eumeta variegata TaxID=151549 RepID=A0A4C1ZXK2_EUMVA|nr:hypothetical protein EVAR_33149_1 [Eumeta japonica]